MIIAVGDKVRPARIVVLNNGATISGFDAQVLVVSFVVGFSLFGLFSPLFKCPIHLQILVLSLSTAFSYVSAKLFLLLLSVCFIPFCNKHYQTYYFCQEQLWDKNDNTKKRANSQEIVGFKIVPEIVCFYEEIREIIVKHNIIQVYIPVTIVNKGIKKMKYNVLSFAPTDFQDGVTVDDWLNEVQHYNPTVKVKRYKSRWWMF